MITPAPWCLTRAEAAVFGMLYRWRLVTREVALAAVSRVRRGAEVSRIALARLLTGIRRKLGPYDITVANHSDEGWYLDDRSRARARYLITRAFGAGAAT